MINIHLDNKQVIFMSFSNESSIKILTQLSLVTNYFRKEICSVFHIKLEDLALNHKELCKVYTLIEKIRISFPEVVQHKPTQEDTFNIHLIYIKSLKNVKAISILITSILATMQRSHQINTFILIEILASSLALFLIITHASSTLF